MKRRIFLGLFPAISAFGAGLSNSTSPLTIEQKQGVLKYALCQLNSLEANEEYSICHAGPYLGLHKEGMFSNYFKFEGETEDFSKTYDMFMDGKYSIIGIKVK